MITSKAELQVGPVLGLDRTLRNVSGRIWAQNAKLTNLFLVLSS